MWVCVKIGWTPHAHSEPYLITHKTRQSPTHLSPLASRPNSSPTSIPAQQRRHRNNNHNQTVTPRHSLRLLIGHRRETHRRPDYPAHWQFRSRRQSQHYAGKSEDRRVNLFVRHPTTETKPKLLTQQSRHNYYLAPSRPQFLNRLLLRYSFNVYSSRVLRLHHAYTNSRRRTDGRRWQDAPGGHKERGKSIRDVDW